SVAQAPSSSGIPSSKTGERSKSDGLSMKDPPPELKPGPFEPDVPPTESRPIRCMLRLLADDFVPAKRTRLPCGPENGARIPRALRAAQVASGAFIADLEEFGMLFIAISGLPPAVAAPLGRRLTV